MVFALTSHQSLLHRTMNCITATERQVVDLVDVVDFKWLMAHEGHTVNGERLQLDRIYARECLALAAASRQEALRRVAQRLAAQLGLQAA